MTGYVAARAPSDKPGMSAALLLFQVAGQPAFGGGLNKGVESEGEFHQPDTGTRGWACWPLVLQPMGEVSSGVWKRQDCL